MSEGETQFKPAVQVVTAECGDEVVLFHVTKGVYYGLDEVGTQVWTLLGEGKGAEAIVRDLLERYDADEPRMRTDVGRLLGDMAQEGLVETA